MIWNFKQLVHMIICFLTILNHAYIKWTWKCIICKIILKLTWQLAKIILQN
jgi:hypothetical protein